MSLSAPQGETVMLDRSLAFLPRRMNPLPFISSILVPRGCGKEFKCCAFDSHP